MVNYQEFIIVRGFGGVYDVLNRQGDLVANDLKTELDAYIFIHEMKA